MTWLLLAAALIALYLAARSAVTVCVLEIRAGKVRVARGAIAPRVLADLEDVARSPPIPRADVRVTRSGGRAATQVRGDVPEAQAQRLRNVIGSLPLAALKSSPRARR